MTIIVTFVGLSIAATGLLASAASIGLTGTKIGAATEDVTACDTTGGVSVSWASEYSAALPGYRISSVTVAGIDAACNGASLSVTLADSADASMVALGPVTVDATSETITVGGTVSAELVESASVILTGP